jgi:DnaJ-class molecular chaperone
MYLEHDRKKEELHLIIKRFQENFLDNFIQSGIAPCSKCRGSGICVSSIGHSSLISWDGHNYCEDCKGLGYVGILEGESYICNNCKGQGCGSCHFIGKVIWLDKIMMMKG